MYDKAFRQQFGDDLMTHILKMGATAYRTGVGQEYEGRFEFDNPWGLDIGMDFTITCERPNDARD